MGCDRLDLAEPVRATPRVECDSILLRRDSDHSRANIRMTHCGEKWLNRAASLGQFDSLRQCKIRSPMRRNLFRGIGAGHERCVRGSSRESSTWHAPSPHGSRVSIRDGRTAKEEIEVTGGGAACVKCDRKASRSNPFREREVGRGIGRVGCAVAWHWVSIRHIAVPAVQGRSTKPANCVSSRPTCQFRCPLS